MLSERFECLLRLAASQRESALAHFGMARLSNVYLTLGQEILTITNWVCG